MDLLLVYFIYKYKIDSWLFILRFNNVRKWEFINF